MAIKQASFHCPQCHQMKLFQAHSMNHVPHILASVFLCGLWLPVWALLAMGDSPNWHCSFCGFTDQSKYLVDPNLRQRQAVEAAHNAQIREQTRSDRSGSTFQERISYFVSDYQTALIAAGVISGLIGAIVFVSVITGPKPSTPETKSEVTASVEEKAKVEARRVFARNAKLTYAKTFPGIEVIIFGPASELLRIEAKTLNEKFVNEFKQQQLGKLKELGFATVLISSGRETWTLTP